MKAKTLVGTVAVVIVLVLAITAVYDLNGGSLDLRDREVRLVVTGSMDGEPTDYGIPTIPVDSLIVIEGLDPEELPYVEVGEVLSYRSSDMVIVHRVVDNDVHGQRFILKGDANPSSERVDYSDVTGHVVGVSEGLGKATVFVQENLVLLVVGLIAASGIVWALKQLIGKDGKEV